MKEYIQVFGRIKPSTADGDDVLELLGKNRIRCKGFGGKEAKVYELNEFFSPSSPQIRIFNAVAKSLVEDVVNGINGTIFAYGQTGSGKSFTMNGPDEIRESEETIGLIPRSIEHLFKELETKSSERRKFTYSVVSQFVEIFNEDIYDLLGTTPNKVTLRDYGSDLRLDKARSETVSNSSDLMLIVKRGWKSRRSEKTAMNRDSSRSHALLILKVISEEWNGSTFKTRQSTLSLVDLAGSERQSYSKAQGERLKEATNINASLSTLGRCIRLLANQNDRNLHIPFRESVLTHLLKSSLGGNSKTSVIVNLHSDRLFLAETTSTLMFACACSRIRNEAIKNETVRGDSAETYKMPIQNSRREMALVDKSNKSEFHEKISQLERSRKEWEEKATILKDEIDKIRLEHSKHISEVESAEFDSSSPTKVKPPRVKVMPSFHGPIRDYFHFNT